MICANKSSADEQWLKRYEERQENEWLEEELQARLNGTI